jgi:hypothetical protein
VLTHPATTIMRIIASLITPKRFCNRKPHFKAQPWMRNAEVIQANPTARWFQRSTGTWAACRMYSPKTTELDPAQPI